MARRSPVELARDPDVRRGAVAAVLAALVVAVLGMLVGRYAAHGIDVALRARVGPRTVTVDDRVEHRTSFANGLRPANRIIQEWRYAEWPIPAAHPTIDARIHARLRLDAPSRLRARSGGTTKLRVGAVDVTPATEVARGTHEIEIVWTGGADDGNFLVLEEASPDPRSSWTEVPRDRLEPLSAGTPPLRLAVWIVTPLLALLAAAAAFFTFRSPLFSTRARRAVLVACAALVLLGTVIRVYDYDLIPDFRENGDELFAMWNGYSLLEDGKTRGWSLWNTVYGNRVQREHLPLWRPQPWAVITPYFEHPPLLHLFVGAALHLEGTGDWRHGRVEVARLVPIALSVISMFFLVAIARRLDPVGPAPILSTALYATIPFIALQHRAVKEEAMVVPLLLAAVWLYLKWRDDGERTWHLALAGLLVGLTGLAKMTGFFLIPALMALPLSRGRVRPALIAGAAGLLSLLLLFVYAAAIDWSLFWFATDYQATGRPMHWNLFPRFFDDPLVNMNLVGRGLLLFLWIAWVAGVSRRPRRFEPVLAVLPTVYLCAIAIGSGNWTYGWYLMPIYPFLCLGAGRFLADLWEDPDFARGMIFVGLALMYSMNFTVDTAWARLVVNSDEIRGWVTAFVAVFLLPYALHQALPSRITRAVARTALGAGLVLLVVLGCRFVLKYDVFYESYRNFDRDYFFDR